MTEICCANCKHEPLSKCGRPSACLIHKGKYQEYRGKHSKNYYNHFVPKEDKMFKFVCKQCGKSLEEGTYCTCVPRKEDNMAFIPGGGYWKTTGATAEVNKVEYKATGKSLTARQVIAESGATIANSEGLIRWIKDYTGSLDANLFKHSEFLKYALKDSCFRDFLLAGKYIEKVDTWVPVKVGDRFMYEDTEYILYRATPRSKHVGFLPINGSGAGTRIENNTTTINTNSITKSEFKQICGSIPIDELERI